MAIEFELPELGEGVESAEVSNIYVGVDDEIEADDNVMELESEKAVMDLPCPHEGRVLEVLVSEGDTVKVGQALLRIESGNGAGEPDEESRSKAQGDAEPGAEAIGEAEPSDAAGGDTETDVVAEILDEGEGRDEEEVDERPDAAADGPPAPAGPATRRLARELEVDLAKLDAPEGEAIRQHDVVRAYLERRRGGAKQPELPDFAAQGPTERRSLGDVRRTAARRLARSWRSIPHVTQHGTVDITELEEQRRRYARSRGEGQTGGDDAAEVTLTAIVVSAVCPLLKEMPELNASLDLDAAELILKQYYNIGVAVDTERGLVVPVVRGADRKSIREVAEEIDELAERARRRRLSRDHLEGATFTISNQGGIGGGHFTPIVDWPQVALLGLGRAAATVRMGDDGKPEERLELPLSLSYDHRVINGADAARFVERFAAVLGTPSKLMMEA